MFKIRDGLSLGATVVIDSNGNITTNAATATQLVASRTLTLDGIVTGTVQTNFSGTTTITTALSNTTVTAGTYRSVTVGADGRITAGTNPTTLAGYGIVDAQPLMAKLSNLAAMSSTTGFVIQSGTDTFIKRNFAVGSGLSIADPSGVAGSPTISLDAGLASIAALTGAGVLTATSTDTFAMRAIGASSSTDILDRAAADARFAALSHTHAISDTTGLQAALDGKLALAGGTMLGTLTLAGAPSSALEAATKAYVDSVVSGMDVKTSARAATTANITLSGTQTIDGVLLAVNDRVLVKDQSTPSQNGIYTCLSGSWTRVTDLNSWTQFPGAFLFVEEGTINGDTGWVCSVDAGGTLGSSAVAFNRFAGVGTYTAGTGLVLTGTQFALTGEALAANNINSTGFVRRTGTNTWSASAIVNADLPTSGVSASTYRSVTVNAQGVVTAGTNPTTISGYGLTDAASLGANTFTGGQIINTGAATASLRLDAAASNYKWLEFSTAGSRRWLVYTNNDAETGANAGSTFIIGAYTDTGTFSAEALRINRSTGVVQFASTPTVSGSTIWHAGNDGTGTGMDSDLLDGQHGAYYLDSVNFTGTLAAARFPAFTGDITTSAGAVATTLATVNANVGTFGSTTQVGSFTVNAKGLITAASGITVTPAWGSITSKPTTLSGYSITGADVLATLLTVDGAASGVDADLLDGQEGAYYQNATNITAGTLAAGRFPAFTGDITTSAGAVATTLATVNSNVGSFGSATAAGTFTVNAKGLITAASSTTITPAWGSITSKPTTISGYGITDAVNLGGSTMTGLLTLSGDPSSPLHAATKQYVDNSLQGLSAKTAVHVATTANITLSGIQTIDGVAVIAGDRVLVKNQTSTLQNGIYVCAAGAWARATDASTWAELVSAYVFVEEGSTSADTGWTCTVNAGGTLETTAVTWVQFSGSATFTASTGIIKSGVDFQLTGQALAIHNLGTTGVVRRTGADTFTASALVNGDLPTSGVSASTYRSVTVNAQGIITAGTNPTTISGYGLTDAVLKTGDTMTGNLLLTGGGTYSEPATIAGVLSMDTVGGDFTISSRSNGGSTGIAFRTSSSGTGAVRMRISSTGDVGIGASAPSQKFAVDVSREQVFGVDTLGYVTMPHADASGYSVLKAASGRGLRFMSSSTTLFTLPTSTASTVSLGYAALQIGDSSSNGYSIYLGSIGGSDLNLRGGDGNVARTADVIISVKNNVEVARFTDTGSVGIGTSAPVAILHASDGTVNAASGLPTAIVTAANRALTSEASLFSIQSTTAQAADMGGSINLGGRGTDASTSAVSFAHIAGRKENGTTGNFAGYLQFGTSDSLSDLTERMRISSVGNVGIGTVTPGANLNVVGTIATEQSVGGYTSALHWQSNNPALGYYAADGLLFGTLTTMGGAAWSEKMRLTNGGNLGVGTTAPLAKLHVTGSTKNGSDPTYRGDIIIDQTGVSESDHGGVEFKTDIAGSGYGNRILSVFDGSSAYDLRFQNRTNSASWTTRMTIAAAGGISFSSGTILAGGSTVWHSGNDGAASGLDADLLDGQHGTYYAPIASPTFTGTVTLPADPASALQAATKQYVDNLVQGISPKQSVHVATTANITLSGTQTIDGVAVIAGDRVLVKNQTSALQNGIYVCAAGAWARAADASTWAELVSAYTFIEEGSTLADTGWTCTVNAGGTLETTAVTWVQFSGSATFTASTGITKSGVDFQLTGQALALHNLGSNGLIVRTGSGVVNNRSIVAPAAGITITAGDGVSGNPTLVLANDLAAVEGLATTGVVRRTATDTWSASALVNGDLPTSGVSASTYRSVTVNAQGIVTAGTNPTTISGYGIAASDILTTLLTVDGASSGLDADLLDGNHGSYYAPLANPNLTGIVTITGPAPRTRLDDNSYTVGSALGLVEIQTNGAQLFFRRNTSTNRDFATYVDDITISSAGVTTIGTTTMAAADTAQGLLLKSGAATGTWLAYYADSAAQSTRSAYVGFGGSSTPHFHLYNERSGGNIEIYSTGGGALRFNSSTIWHAGNDGAGSGLDADTLDGVQGGNYARLDLTTTQNFGGYGLYLNGGRGISIGYSGGNYGSVGYNVNYTVTSGVQTAPSTDTASMLSFNSGGMLLQGNAAGTASRTITWTDVLSVPLSGSMTYLGNTVWHSGNDGAGSTLDADLLDGQQGSYYTDIPSRLGFTPVNRAAASDAWDTPPAYTAIIGNTGGHLGVGSTSFGLSIDYSSTYKLQLSGRSSELYLRTMEAGSFGSWHRMWHAGNDGAASGLDADLLDGQHGSYYQSASNINAGTIGDAYLPSTMSGKTFTGNIQTTNGADRSLILASSTSYNYQLITAGDHFQIREASDAAKIRMQIAYPSGNISFQSTSVTAGGNTMWHAGNDGTGSGLDADLLDGLNSASAATASTIVARDGSANVNANNFISAVVAGVGLQFWASSSYSIYMSDAANVTYGGRVGTESTSDYNMYFKMTSGTNRGFVFLNGTTPTANIDASGNTRNIGFTRSKNGFTDYGTNNGSANISRINMPGGASYQCQTASITGAIKIKLPNLDSNAMMRFRVEIYNYSTGQSSTFVISGYPFSSSWINVSAEQFTDTGVPMTVRFGHDGATNCVWIGELATVWAYPQVFVTDFNWGYASVTTDAFSSNWAISFATSFGTVGVSRAAAYHWNNANDGASSGLDADLLDGQQGSYYQSASNLNAGTLLAARMPALTGDITTSAGAVATTLATVNSNVGSFGSATQTAAFTVNAKGLTTAASNITITPAWSSITSKPTTLSGYGITDALASTVNTWINSSEGQSRFYFATGGHTYYRTAASHIFYNTASSTIGTLDGSGNWSVIGDITAYSSDERLKENVRVIEDPLGKIDQIGGYLFDWRKEVVDELGFTPYQYEDEHGFLAQEIQKIMPDAVRPAPFSDKYLTVKYERLVPLAIEGIKALKKENEALRQENEDFRQELNDLKTLLREKGII